MNVLQAPIQFSHSINPDAAKRDVVGVHYPKHSKARVILPLVNLIKLCRSGVVILDISPGSERKSQPIRNAVEEV